MFFKRGQWAKLMGELPAWQKSCKLLAKMNFQEFDFRKGLDTLEGNTLYSDDRRYNSIHFLRALVFALGGYMAETKENWELLRDMGGASSRAQTLGVFTFGQAAACAAQILQKQRQDYHLEDLSCFCCLAHALDGC